MYDILSPHRKKEGFPRQDGGDAGKDRRGKKSPGGKAGHGGGGKEQSESRAGEEGEGPAQSSVSPQKEFVFLSSSPINSLSDTIIYLRPPLGRSITFC